MALELDLCSCHLSLYFTEGIEVLSMSLWNGLGRFQNSCSVNYGS